MPLLELAPLVIEHLHKKGFGQYLLPNPLVHATVDHAGNTTLIHIGFKPDTSAEVVGKATTSLRENQDHLESHLRDDAKGSLYIGTIAREKRILLSLIEGPPQGRRGRGPGGMIRV